MGALEAGRPIPPLAQVLQQPDQIRPAFGVPEMASSPLFLQLTTRGQRVSRACSPQRRLFPSPLAETTDLLQHGRRIPLYKLEMKVQENPIICIRPPTGEGSPKPRHWTSGSAIRFLFLLSWLNTQVWAQALMVPGAHATAQVGPTWRSQLASTFFPQHQRVGSKGQAPPPPGPQPL